MLYKLFRANLYLFGDGGDGASASAAAESSEGSAEETGENYINPLTGREVKGEFKETLKASKANANAESAESETENNDTGAADQTEQSASVDREKAFKDLINGEYKDLYTKATQDMINKRFKQTKDLESNAEKSRPLFEALAAKYNLDASDIDGITNAVNDDNAMWEEKADEAGMTVEQYKQFQKLQRDSAELQRQEAARTSEARAQAQLQKWNSEAETLKQTFPDFDLNKEAENPEFLSLLRAGLPVDNAYKVIHMDEIVGASMKQTAALAEKRAVENVRARGSRPSENGAANRSAFTTSSDVHKLTKADRAELARRAIRGERIEFPH